MNLLHDLSQAVAPFLHLPAVTPFLNFFAASAKLISSKAPGESARSSGLPNACNVNGDVTFIHNVCSACQSRCGCRTHLGRVAHGGVRSKPLPAKQLSITVGSFTRRF